MRSDLLARATIVTLYTLLSVNLLGDFLRTGHLTGLLLLVSESLVVVMTVMRRRASLVDRSAAAALVTAVSAVGPTLVRATEAAGLVPDLATAAVSAAGLGLVVAGKLALGRSFGLIPANRGVVVAGPYGTVRHPIYAGYLVTHAAFLAAHPHWWNLVVLVVADGALVVRARLEERVLRGDATYRAYCRRVPWHVVPGVY
ncbi:MAG: isoprenylcysteine carboxylmethyltransferase family protein [Acidobacteria bacterium]|nr:isoprenylcysteine carboxylmethyltransferase family protein [Acidobacteriota bacterium]